MICLDDIHFSSSPGRDRSLRLEALPHLQPGIHTTNVTASTTIYAGGSPGLASSLVTMLQRYHPAPPASSDPPSITPSDYSDILLLSLRSILLFIMIPHQRLYTLSYEFPRFPRQRKCFYAIALRIVC
jgi:hypothetical protein